MIKLESEILYFHSKNVASMSVSLSRALSTKPGSSIWLTPAHTELLKVAGFLHDIGKVAIPDGVIIKQEKLSNDEISLLKGHPIRGWEILTNNFSELLCSGIRSVFKDHICVAIGVGNGKKQITETAEENGWCEPCTSIIKELGLIVRHHHEVPDGTGYPDGLYGDQMTPLIKIISIADKICALTEERPYRLGAFPRESAIKKVLMDDYDWQMHSDEIAIMAEAAMLHFSKEKRPDEQYTVL